MPIVTVDGLDTDEHVQRRVLQFVSASPRHDRVERAFRALLAGPTFDSARLVWETPDGRLDARVCLRGLPD